MTPPPVQGDPSQDQEVRRTTRKSFLGQFDEMNETKAKQASESIKPRKRERRVHLRNQDGLVILANDLSFYL